MYKSVKVEDILGKSNFNKDYLDRASLILSNRADVSSTSIKLNSDNKEDSGWKEIDKKIAESLKASNTQTNEVLLPARIHVENVSNELNELLNMFSAAGINVRVTSGYREGAVQANGKPSLHASGNAVDIVPVNGDYQAIDVAIANNPQIIDYMRRTGIGIYREIDPEVMRQTGATGPHYHMGKGAGNSYLNSIKQYVKQV